MRQCLCRLHPAAIQCSGKTLSCQGRKTNGRRTEADVAAKADRRIGEVHIENPYFYQVGDFNIAADIDTTTGLTLHSKGSHAGPNYGFFSAVKLKGYCPKALPLDPSQVMHYRFLYIDPTAHTVEVPITGDRIGTATEEVVVGARMVPWNQFGIGLTDTYQDIVIHASGTA